MNDQTPWVKIVYRSSQDGFWIRDGDNFINVENNVDGSLFNGITVIEVNKSNKIERVVNLKVQYLMVKTLIWIQQIFFPLIQQIY